MSSFSFFYFRIYPSYSKRFLPFFLFFLIGFCIVLNANAQTKGQIIENAIGNELDANPNPEPGTIVLNASGGKTATDGLRIYISPRGQMQIFRNGKSQLNTTVFRNDENVDYPPYKVGPKAPYLSPKPLEEPDLPLGVLPKDDDSANNLYNGIYIRYKLQGDGDNHLAIAGPNHNKIRFNPDLGNSTRTPYASATITSPQPANPNLYEAQSATQTVTINGLQAVIKWTYVRPDDFLTADVTFTIPNNYVAGVSNNAKIDNWHRVNYYHTLEMRPFGSENGCHFTYYDPNIKLRVVGAHISVLGEPMPVDPKVYYSYNTPIPGYYSDAKNGYASVDGAGVKNSCPQDSGVGNAVFYSPPKGITNFMGFRERGKTAFSGFCALDQSWEDNGKQDFWTEHSYCSVYDKYSHGDRDTGTDVWGVGRSADGKGYLVTNGGAPEWYFGDYNHNQPKAVGIAYSFNKPGIYNFSYDLVIGKLFAFEYDHLEVQHAGEISPDCPSDIVILLCKVGTSPCPEDQVVTSGGTVSGTFGGDNLVIGSGGTSTNFSVGEGNPKAFYSIKANSSAPLGEMKFWVDNLTPPKSVIFYNTKTKTSTPGTSDKTQNVKKTCFDGDFECMTSKEAFSSNGGNPLYTQVSGINITDLKIVAIDKNGVPINAYVSPAGGLDVELVDASTQQACTAYSTAVKLFTGWKPVFDVRTAETTISISNPQIINKTIPQAFEKMRCRVRAARFPTTYGCSTDTFTVRPQSFTIPSPSSLNADASSGTSTTNTPVTKAGATFTLTAESTQGYSGAPQLKSDKLTAHSGAQQKGILEGAFGSATASTSKAPAQGNFTYSDVGYFQLEQEAVYDDTFTDKSLDQTKGHCILNSFSNTPDAKGKVGCGFANNTASNYFGRFVPDRFTVSIVEACPVGKFTYEKQPVSLKVWAQNLQGVVTQNYHGGYARAIVISDADTSANKKGSFTGGEAQLSSAWDKGMLEPQSLVYDQSLVYAFSTSPTVPSLIKVAAKESSGFDGVSTSTTSEGSLNLRSGRFSMKNASGSAKSNLHVPFVVAYYDANGNWVTNVDDACTQVEVVFTTPSPADLPLCLIDIGKTGSRSGQGCLITTPATQQFKEGGVSDFKGDFNAWVGAPMRSGSAFLEVPDTVAAKKWLGAPRAKLIFGGVSRSSSVIYRREVF